MDINNLLNALSRIYEQRGYEVEFTIEKQGGQNEKEDKKKAV